MNIEPPDDSGAVLPAGRTTPEDREAALRHCLRGVDLDAHDDRVVRWLSRILDDWTVRTLLSLFDRVRQISRGAA
ncbi:hypothetical protein AB0B66_18910 [Catellatospora sp. NPDC049111]|uniref:hypothetical protein n=1 Tax=Catellatospora sp. NPDC049111 TaxID=3155271 RepID=UPI0033DA4842